MLRLTLIIVLIAATCSAQDDDEETWRLYIEQTCFGNRSPFVQCLWKNFGDYATFRRLGEEGVGFSEGKQILQEENVLENLCSEARSAINCIITGVYNVREECLEEYEKAELSIDKFEKISSYIELLCTDDVIEDIRENLDCMYDRKLIEDVNKCSFKNPDHDCSQFENTADTSENERERHACYEEQTRKTCDNAQVVNCAADKVDTKCGKDAKDLTELAANALFEIFPLCSDDIPFRSLLKHFRK